MFQAWETVSKWELLEPVQHRPPLPEPILHAMACLGLSWGWFWWTAILLAAFYSISRVGELLRAVRSDVLTPADLLDDDEKIYIRISEPKTRKRGARTQHVTVDSELCLKFVAWVWGKLNRQDLLYSGSAGAFRSRWNATLRHLGISNVHRLTPGSLRAGGAVAAHRLGMHISDLMWRMRLQHVQTLSHYLQEKDCDFNLTSTTWRCQRQDSGAPSCAATLASRVGPVARMPRARSIFVPCCSCSPGEEWMHRNQCNGPALLSAEKQRHTHSESRPQKRLVKGNELS